MRIGVVTASYPRHDGDAAGSFVAAHVAALRAAGHEVDIVGAHTIASSLFYAGGAPDALERGGLRTYLAAARFTAQLTFEVARCAHTWDLVIAHWLVPSALAAIPVRVPILAIAHGGDVHTLRRFRLLAPMLRMLRARDARLVFVSEELRRVARDAAPRLRAYIDEALVQPMGIDVERFAAIARARRTRGSSATLPTILVVSRLVPVKGVDIAIAAHRSLRTHARLVIAGDGPERAHLERLAKSGDANHARTNDIMFIGAVDAEQRDQLLRDATLVVIPSRVLPNGRTEGNPMIALEALASGVPVIASAVGGLADLAGVTHVRSADPHALAAAIDHALTGPEPVRDDTYMQLADLDWRHVSARLLVHVARSAKRVTRAHAALRKGLRTAVRPLAP